MKRIVRITPSIFVTRRNIPAPSKTSTATAILLASVLTFGGIMAVACAAGSFVENVNATARPVHKFDNNWYFEANTNAVITHITADRNKEYADKAAALNTPEAYAKQGHMIDPNNGRYLP